MSPRYLSELTWDELQSARQRAEEDVDMAQYADSNRPMMKARARLDAINAEIRNRQNRAAT